MTLISAFVDVAGRISRATDGVVVRINRSGSEWHHFWDEGKAVVEKLQREFPRAGWQFLRPAMQARLECFAECHARLVAEVVRRVERPRVLNQHGLGIVELATVFDSDIQGEENLHLFQSIWENEHPSFDRFLRARWQYALGTKSVRLSTEEKEPCLLLADYLAGIVHTYRGSLPRPSKITAQELRSSVAALEATGRLIECDMRSQLRYPEFMATSPLRGLLWPDASP